MRAAFSETVLAYGGVDIVVSNAGISTSHPVEDTSLDEWNLNMSVLGTGYFLVAREAFRVLRAQERGGSVVFVASKNGLVGGRNASAYSSAKALEIHLARCLAEEGGGAGIRVEHGQSGRGPAGLRHLELGLARAAREHLRHRPRRARRALPCADDAESQRLSRRHRRSRRVLRLAAVRPSRRATC